MKLKLHFGALAPLISEQIKEQIDDLFSDMDFDDLLIWANALGVEINYPPVADMWPDWENELTVETAEELSKAIEFNINEICCTLST